jgi:hypothetical protein
MAKRRIGSIREELLTKSKEAALSAVKIFNDPLIKFKSETFIVLMNIAWTYLLHSYYRSKGIEYRYFKVHGRKRFFDKTKRGFYKYWELERCLNEEKSPIDKNTNNNLKFLIGLRHEIEHQMTLSLDEYLSGRYQACILNYNQYLKKLFGFNNSLDEHLSYSLQFIEISEEQFEGANRDLEIPNKLKSYIIEFDGLLDHDEYNSSNYSYRLLFKKKIVNKPGQADKVVEFIDPKSDLAKTIDKEYWVKKEVEKIKYKPSGIVEQLKKAGYNGIKLNPHHTRMWQSEDAKNPSKGYGVNIAGCWYWYENWLNKCLEICETAGDTYK